MGEALATVLNICTVIGLVVFAALIIAGFYSRRHEGRADRPGVRTIATFTGAMALVLDDERQRLQVDGPAALGEGLMQGLGAALEAHGVVMSAVDAEDHGWGGFVSMGDATGYLRVGLRTSGAIDDREDELEADEWVLMLDAPSGGGPGPAALLPSIHHTLEAVEVIDDVRWHPRHHFDQGEESGEPFPLDTMA